MCFGAWRVEERHRFGAAGGAQNARPFPVHVIFVERGVFGASLEHLHQLVKFIASSLRAVGIEYALFTFERNRETVVQGARVETAQTMATRRQHKNAWW